MRTTTTGNRSKKANAASKRRRIGASGIVTILVMGAVVLSFLWQMAMGLCPVP